MHDRRPSTTCTEDDTQDTSYVFASHKYVVPLRLHHRHWEWVKNWFISLHYLHALCTRFCIGRKHSSARHGMAWHRERANKRNEMMKIARYAATSHWARRAFSYILCPFVSFFFFSPLLCRRISFRYFCCWSEALYFIHFCRLQRMFLSEPEKLNFD